MGIWSSCGLTLARGCTRACRLFVTCNSIVWLPMKVLHVMPEFPYPPDAGGRADIWNRLRMMSHLGYGIDGLVMEQKRVPEERRVAEMWRFVSNSSLSLAGPCEAAWLRLFRPRAPSITHSRTYAFTSNMTLPSLREKACGRFSIILRCRPKYGYYGCITTKVSICG